MSIMRPTSSAVVPKLSMDAIAEGASVDVATTVPKLSAVAIFEPGVIT